jgi:hypothetical protein
VAVGLLAACAPEFTVTTSLVVPAGFEESLSLVRLQVLEPPRSNPFDCAALALSNVEPTLLELSIVEEIRAAPGEKVELQQLSRVAKKIYLANALDEAGRVLFVGCADVAEIEEDTAIQIVGEPMPVLTVQEISPLSGRLGDPNILKPELEILARDILGRPASTLEVSWMLAGADEVASGSDRTRVDGLVRLFPQRPQRSGPFLVEIGVRWGEPVLVEGVIVPAPLVGSVDAAFDDTVEIVTGRLGASGEPAVVALVQERDAARVVTMTFDPLGERFVYVTSDPLPGIFSFSGPVPVAFGRLEDETGARDRLVLIAPRARLSAEVAADGRSFTTRAFDPATIGNRDVRRVLPAGDCAGASTRMLVELVDGAFGFFREDGSLDGELFTFGADPEAAVGFIAAGCLSDTRGTRRRTFVYDPGLFGLIFLTDEGGGEFLTGQWSALGEGLQILGRRSPSTRRVLATQIQLDELAMSRGVLEVVREGANAFLRIVPEVVDRAVGFPVSLGAGDIDGDSQEDLVSFADVSRTLDEVRYGLQVVLAREHRGRRVGGSIVITASGTERVFVADFDGDGADDVALITGRGATGKAMEIKLYRMGRLNAQ